MTWKLVLLLSFFGLAMGIAATLGLTKGLEPLLWVTIAVIVGLVLGQNNVPKPFVHGFLVGLAAGIWAAIIEASFFSTYLSHNPESSTQFAKAPFEPRLFVLLTSPVTGSIYGLVVGFVTWLAATLLFNKERVVKGK